jgi:hypothetical protein
MFFQQCFAWAENNIWFVFGAQMTVRGAEFSS